MSATVTTPTAVRGLLVHDPRLAEADIVASDSAGPHPTITRPASDIISDAILEVTGDSDGTTRYVHTMRGGGAVPGTAARIGWSTDGTSTTQRGGWNRRIVSGYEPVVLAAGSYQFPYAVVTGDGTMVIVYYNGTKTVSLFRDLDDESVSTYGLRAWGAGGDVGVAGSGIPVGLLRLPDTGRLLCLMKTSAVYGTTTYTTFNLWYSDSDGTTWTLGQTDVGARIDTSALTFEQAHWAYHQGVITLVLQATTGASGSWVSYDRGSSFTQIEAIGSGWTTTASQAIVTCDDGSVLLFYVDGTSNLAISRKRTPSASFSADPTFGTQISGAVWGSTNTFALAACIDRDGLVTVLGRLTGDINTHLLRVRQDVSSTAGVIADYAPGDGSRLEPIYLGAGATSYLQLYTLVAWRDCLYALTLDNNASPFVGLLRFGGWSSLDWDGWPSFGALYGTATVYGWTWVGALDPASCGWTAAGAGTSASSALGGWALTTVANQKQFSRTGVAGRTVAAWARVRVGSGGALTADDIAMRLVYETGAGVNRYDISIRFSGTGIRMYDNNAAATVGTDVSGLTSGNYVDVYASLSGSRCVLYYKTPATTLWTLGPSGTATAAATAGATSTFAWGNLSAGTATSHWGWVFSALDNRVQDPSISEPNNARPVNGLELSSRPMWLQSGIYLRARSTPVLAGETFTVGTRYDYGALDPVSRVAPGEEWRSTADSAEVTIRWTYDTTTAANSFGWSSSFGICLRNPTFRTAYLEADDGGGWGAAVSLVTIDTATGMSSLEFTRSGYVLAPTNTPVGGRYVQANEYAGGYALLVSGGTTYPVLLEGNRAGVWRSTGGSQSCVLQIDRTVNLTGLPSSGTIHLIPTLFVAMKHAIAAGYRAYQLRIPAQDTYGNYFGMRPPILGSFLAFGWDYSRGRLVGSLRRESAFELPSGSRRVRALARPRRYVEIAWNDTIPGGGTGGVWGASPEPSVIAVSGSTPVAVLKDPAMLEGMIQVVSGTPTTPTGSARTVPVVYLPSVATGSTTSQFSMRELILPGHIVGDGGARTHTVGRYENSTEGDTLGTVRIEELP